jgi:uroporphyrinogen III methyltransferase/synthase
MKPVMFIGAGPGDPGLLTVWAIQLLEKADVIFHDELVSKEILDMLPAARPYKGMAEVIEAVRQGKSVARLQIGDPTIFGRLVEQMEALDEADIGYEIVPGVTAATAAAAAAGISLTHRTLGRSVAIVSAHDDSIPVPDADTVVYYMGRPATPGPVVVVENATRPNERVLRDPAAAKAPSVVISGAVADLASLPLYRQRIIVTRAENSRLNQLLRKLGAEVVEFPVIRITPPANPAPLENAVANLRDYDWLIFTSANGVRAFFDRVRDLRTLRAKICAIGPATRTEVEKHKLIVDAFPEEYVGEGLLRAMPGDLSGQRVLMPRAAVARDVVPESLRARGAHVDVVEAYRTLPPDPPPALPGAADWVTFTSSSTVKNYLAMAGKPQARIASIGPITSDTLRRHGLEPDAEAAEYTVDGLVEAILKHS